MRKPLFLVLVAMLSACTGSSAGGSRASGSAAEPRWNELRRDCAPGCRAEELLIRSSGDYALRAGTARSSGRLSDEERAEAVLLGNGVVPGAALACESFAPEEGRTLVISILEPGRDDPRTVYEESSDAPERCFGAPRGAALALRAFLDRVEAKAVAQRPPYDPCAAKSCGQGCTVCDPADRGCVETAVLKQCSREGKCVAGFPSCEELGG